MSKHTLCMKSPWRSALADTVCAQVDKQAAEMTEIICNIVHRTSLSCLELGVVAAVGSLLRGGGAWARLEPDARELTGHLS